MIINQTVPKQPRWRSKVMWTAAVVQIITLGQLVGLWDELGIHAGVVGDVCSVILQILVIFGILNDPTNPEGF